MLEALLVRAKVVFPDCHCSLDMGMTYPNDYLLKIERTEGLDKEVVTAKPGSTRYGFNGVSSDQFAFIDMMLYAFRKYYKMEKIEGVETMDHFLDYCMTGSKANTIKGQHDSSGVHHGKLDE